MNFLVTGDWHITNKTPKNRIDDYPTTQFNKIVWILEQAKKHNCKFILQPGDFFDSYKANDYLKQLYIPLFGQYKIFVYLIFGQHCLRFHNSNIENTPLKVMEVGCSYINILKEKSILINGIELYGASWHEDIPKISDSDSFNVLVTHRMVVQEKIWAGQKEGHYANALLKANDFDLIVSGDNHQCFMETIGSKTLLNMGSLMRSTIAQVNHKPSVAIVTVENNKSTIELIHVPIAPINEVMDTNKAEAEKEKNEELDNFITELQNQTKLEGLDFAVNLKKYIDSNKIDDGTKTLIGEVMEEEKNLLHEIHPLIFKILKEKNT